MTINENVDTNGNIVSLDIFDGEITLRLRDTYFVKDKKVAPLPNIYCYKLNDISKIVRGTIKNKLFLKKYLTFVLKFSKLI